MIYKHVDDDKLSFFILLYKNIYFTLISQILMLYYKNGEWHKYVFYIIYIYFILHIN